MSIQISANIDTYSVGLPVKIDIALDGANQDNVIAFSEIDGWLDRYTGRYDSEKAEVERLHGRVEMIGASDCVREAYAQMFPEHAKREQLLIDNSGSEA